MQINKHTDYAFRALIYLAGQGGERVTIQHIAQTYSISKSHLMKIINKLANARIVESTRGKNGGLRLAKPADQITLDAVFTTMNPQSSPVNCSKPPCLIVQSCTLKAMLDGAQQQFIQHLAQFTLQDCLNHSTIQTIQFTRNNQPHAPQTTATLPSLHSTRDV